MGVRADWRALVEARCEECGPFTLVQKEASEMFGEAGMTETRIAILVVLAFSGLTVLADVLIKKAADQNHLWSIFFLFGALIYGLSAFGWFYALRTINLATLGGIYSLSTVVMIALAGVFVFNEKLATVEYVVLGMSIVSIVALWRLL
jgi:drug/metabolite transporter (DMT)-like permease